MIDVNEQLKRPDRTETWRTIRWLCRYNNWIFLTWTTLYEVKGYGIVEGKYETNISINTGDGVVFRESYVGDSEDESQLVCIECAMKRIFDYALYAMTRSIRQMKINNNP